MAGTSENEELPRDDHEFFGDYPVSSFKDAYKSLSKNKESCQAERRELFLKHIKEKRGASIDALRNTEDECEASSMDIDIVKGHTSSQYDRRYKYKLVYTEWLATVPIDLTANWFVKFCPYGKRCLVVTAKTITKCYSRRGKFIEAFRSHLPGGSPSNFSRKVTMLECIYHYESECYFVLDGLYWNSVNLKDAETDFRFYFLESKFEELPELSEVSNQNDYCFKLVLHIPAIPHLINEELDKSVELDESIDKSYDGLLFYHKETPYLSKHTPLVCWSKPYMLFELLNVNVNAFYMAQKPEDYTTLTEYLQRRHNEKEHSQMDVVDMEN